MKTIILVSCLLCFIGPLASEELPKCFQLLPSPQKLEVKNGTGLFYNELNYIVSVNNSAIPVLGNICASLPHYRKKGKGIFLQLLISANIPESEEGYILELDDQGVHIQARNQKGLFYGGYGRTFQDFKINVHISGREGPDGIRRAYSRLSPEARNCITIENEEITHGIEHCLSLSDIIPTVLDIHHHLIREGEYISVDDERIRRVVDSWRSTRPTIHYACSREDILVGHDPLVAPDMATLLESGHKKQKLRAHSDFMWNKASNKWALEHLEWADIMVESKSKNLGSRQLYDQWKK